MSIERKIEDQQKPLTSSYCPVRRHPQWEGERDGEGHADHVYL